MYESFPYVYSEKNPQSQIYLMDLVSFVQIILKRIDAAKEKYGETISSDVRENIKQLQYLKLDVRSLYLFSSAFLDYLVNYISHSFFQDNVKSGLKNNSSNPSVFSSVFICLRNELFLSPDFTLS